MGTQNINSIDTGLRAFIAPPSARGDQEAGTDFKSILDSTAIDSLTPAPDSNLPLSLPGRARSFAARPVVARPEALAAYQNQLEQAEERDARSLAAPASRSLSDTGQQREDFSSTEKESFLGRLGKGISNVITGIRNFFRRLMAGFVSPEPRAPMAPGACPVDETGKVINDLPDPLPPMTDLEKYKDDQLLGNPGGDHYYPGQNALVSNPLDQHSFQGRVGKDISDAFANGRNAVRNFFLGAEIRYRDKDNQVQQARRRGFVGSVVDFFKDTASAVSFGLWRPDGEKAPRGIGQRMNFFFSKMKEAVLGDVVQGASGSLVQMGEDLILAGWNLVEVLPDATIGNFSSGQKLTTTIFDNGQVVIDYLTDILPTGEAWLRVHSMNMGGTKGLQPPVLYNIRMPERYAEDVRWRYVRNTPFRKKIETIGSLLADIITVKCVSETEFSSDEKHHK